MPNLSSPVKQFCAPPNTALERTADRRANLPSMTTTPKSEAQRALVSGFAEIVSDDFPVLHLELCSRHCLLFKTSPNDSEQHDGNDSSPSPDSYHCHRA